MSKLSKLLVLIVTIQVQILPFKHHIGNLLHKIYEYAQSLSMAFAITMKHKSTKAAAPNWLYAAGFKDLKACMHMFQITKYHNYSCLFYVRLRHQTRAY